jgi:hypothetical protein
MFMDNEGLFPPPRKGKTEGPYIVNPAGEELRRPVASCKSSGARERRAGERHEGKYEACIIGG